MLPSGIADLLDLEVQGRHAAVVAILWRQGLSITCMLGPLSWTTELDGRPVASYGILENAYAWALLGEDLGGTMVPITRSVRSVLASYAMIRGPVYEEIDPTHSEAVRWAYILGFQPFEGTTGRFT